MKTKHILPLISLCSLVLSGLACDLTDAGRPIEMSGGTVTAHYIETLEAQSTTNSREATAFFATQQVLALTGTPEPPPTPTECVKNQYGICLPQQIADALVTPTPVFDLPPTIIRARVNRSVEFSSEAGTSYLSSTLGKLMEGTTLDIHITVSGLPGSSEDSPNKDPCRDHYYGTYLVGWLEEVDHDQNLSRTTGIEHDWHHFSATHAHLVDNQGNLIAQIYPRPGANIIKVLEHNPNGSLVKVILQLAWVRSEDVTVIEGCN